MKLTRRGFLAGAGAVAVGSAAWGLDPNRAWADEEAAEEAAGTDEAPAEEPAAPAGPVVVCEECPGACTLVLDVEDGRVAAVHGDGANPFSEGRLCLRAQALTDLWKAPEGTTEDDADDDSGNGAGGNDAASEGATTTSPGRLTSPRVRRAGSDAWEDISWDRALDEIANLVKDTRDATFEESIEGVEADDEAQGETDFDEWDWSDRGGYGDDGYGDNDYGARKRPRALVSALREWWGEEAAFDNDYGYDWLPKAPAGGASFSEALCTGLLQGCFLWGADLVGSASSGVTADDVGRLAWLVVTDGSPNLTATFWERVEDPSQQQTTVFQLPSVLGFEKAGIRASGGRLLQHAEAAVEPAGESRTDAAIIGDMWERVFNLYDTKGGTATDPILKARWDYVTSDSIDLVKMAWAMNGYVVEDSDWGGGELVLLEGADGLRADGSTACGAAFLAGLWSNGASAADAAEQPVGRRDGADESGLGLFPGWGFTWPGNVRVRGNRASANLAGQPWVRERNLLTWEGESWACIDAPDFPILRDGRWLEPDNQAFPGTWEQVGLLVSDRLGDGPVPEHYEPLESPLNNRLNGAYASPVLLAAAAKASGAAGDDGAVDAAVADALAPDYSSMQADRAAYPIAAVINGSDGRDGARRALSETLAAAEPGCFVEMSASLARIRGLATGEWARVFNERGSVEAPVLVTDRIRPFQCEGNEGHYVCLNGMALGSEDAAAAMWGVLAPAAESPVGAARDVKGFLVDIEKA